MTHHMVKILVLSIVLSILVLGCQSPEEAPQPKHDTLIEGEPYMEMGYVYGLELTELGPVEISRVRTVKGIFTVLGHITYKKWTKTYVQGDYLFIYNENKILKRHELF